MRLFVDQAIQIDDELFLDSFASNYIARVLRLKINDLLYLFNGSQPLGEYLAKIIQIDKKQVAVHIESFQAKDIESPVHINLLQGISRGDRMDYTIQKAVELGVNHIYPLFLERTNVKLGDQKRIDKKLSHWQGISHSAMQQSARTALIPIAPPDNLASIANIKADLKLVPDPKAEISLSQLVLTDKLLHINVLIGPEGGITDNERDYAKTLEYIPVRLGPRILRTETAGLAIISYLQTVLGDY
jgi:16S rRNA (uracil1498-N3)-methyltransferase